MPARKLPAILLAAAPLVVASATAGARAPDEPRLPPVEATPAPAQLAWQALETAAFVDLRDRDVDVDALVAACRSAGFDALLIAPGPPARATAREEAADAAVARAAAFGAACAGAGLPLGLVIEVGGATDLAELAGHVEALLAAAGAVMSVAFELEASALDVPAPAVERVRALRPAAVVVGPAGPDARALRDATVPEAHWSTLRAGALPDTDARPAVLRAGDETGARWVPAQCRVALADLAAAAASADDDAGVGAGAVDGADADDGEAVAEALLAVHAESVGRGATLRVDVPLGDDGRVDAAAARALAAWRAAREARGPDLAPRASIAATGVLGGSEGEGAWDAARALDGDPATAWAPPAPRGGALLLAFPEPVAFDTVSLREPLAHGQRVRDFAVDVETPQGGWWTVARGATVGARRDVVVEPVRTRRVRLRLIAARATPALAQLALFRSPPRASLATPPRPFLGELRVALAADAPWAELRYTTDGTTPAEDATLYGEPVRLAATTELRARAFEDGVAGPVVSGTYVAVPSSALRTPISFFREPDPGLRFAVYPDAVDALAELDAAEPARRGVVADLATPVRADGERGAVRLEGHFLAPADGVYGFRLEPAGPPGTPLPGAARLAIAGEAVATLEDPASGFVALAAGWHPLRLDRAADLVPPTVVVDGPSLPDVPLPADRLYQ